MSTSEEIDTSIQAKLHEAYEALVELAAVRFDNIIEDKP